MNALVRIGRRSIVGANHDGGKMIKTTVRTAVATALFRDGRAIYDRVRKCGPR